MNRFQNVPYEDNSVRLRKAHLRSMIENLEDRVLDCTDPKEVGAVNVVVAMLRGDLKKLEGGA